MRLNSCHESLVEQTITEMRWETESLHPLYRQFTFGRAERVLGPLNPRCFLVESGIPRFLA